MSPCPSCSAPAEGDLCATCGDLISQPVPVSPRPPKAHSAGCWCRPCEARRKTIREAASAECPHDNFEPGCSACDAAWEILRGSA